MADNFKKPFDYKGKPNKPNQDSRIPDYNDFKDSPEEDLEGLLQYPKKEDPLDYIKKFSITEFLRKHGLVTQNPQLKQKRKLDEIPPGTFGSGEEGIEPPIDSDRYEIIEVAGQGAWGTVYKARDKEKKRLLGRLNSDLVAIKVLNFTEFAKEKLKERNLGDLEEVLLKEVGNEKGADNIVSRRLERDNNGMPFIVMPYYDAFLSKILDDDENRNELDNGLEESDIYKITRDMLSGLKQAPRVFGEGIVHCDIKPSNIAVDGGLTLDSRPKYRGVMNGKKCLLSDFGTATIESPANGHSGNRAKMGDFYTRSPRMFVQGQVPTGSSDIFSVGALTYRMITGFYPFEEDIETHGTEFMQKLGYVDEKGNINEKALSKAIKSKVKKVPRKFRNFVSRCLTSDLESVTDSGSVLDNSRRYDARRALEDLEKTQRPSLFRRFRPAIFAAQGAMLLSLYLIAKREENRDTVPMDLLSEEIRSMQLDEIVRLKHKDVKFGVKKGDLLFLDQNNNGIIEPNEFRATIMLWNGKEMDLSKYYEYFRATNEPQLNIEKINKEYGKLIDPIKLYEIK